MKGFNEIDNASMIIIKKIIGAHVKTISDSKPNFKKLDIELNKNKNFFEIKLNIDSSSKDGICEDLNIFVCIDSAFKKLNTIKSNK